MRLDLWLVQQNLIASRSQAEQEIAFGHVAVNGRIVARSAYPVKSTDKVRLIKKNPYVSRAGLKLASVARALQLDFQGKVVLDVGSSTGGFTDYVLQHGAEKVIAIDVGTNQLHPKLRGDSRVELHEQTDIREVGVKVEGGSREIEVERSKRDAERGKMEGDSTTVSISIPDFVLIDVSFISLRMVLPHISKLTSPHSLIVAMCKPQFEANRSKLSSGVVKNSAMRRQILADFETWLKSNGFIIKHKADSDIPGEKGNLERFYLLKYRHVHYEN